MKSASFFAETDEPGIENLSSAGLAVLLKRMLPLREEISGCDSAT